MLSVCEWLEWGYVGVLARFWPASRHLDPAKQHAGFIKAIDVDTIQVEFSPVHSNMIRLRGKLAEDSI